MKLMKRKTRKAIQKNVRKAISKHGPAIAAGLIGGIATTLATFANADEPRAQGVSRMRGLSEKAQALFKKDDRKHGKITAKKGVGQARGAGVGESSRVASARD